MKIKKIEKICKSGAQILRVDIPSETEKKLKSVFLGTEYAQFELSKNFREFYPEAFFDVFGIDEKAQKKWWTDHETAEGEDAFLYGDVFSGEKIAYPQELLLTYGGITWKAFQYGGNKVCFVPESWLSVYDSEDEDVYYFIRKAGPNEYLAVKIGMYLDGVIRVPKSEFSKPLEEMRAALQLLALHDRGKQEGAGNDGE